MVEIIGVSQISCLVLNIPSVEVILKIIPKMGQAEIHTFIIIMEVSQNKICQFNGFNQGLFR